MKDASNIGVTGCIDAVHMAFMASGEKRHSRLTNVASTVCVSKAFHCLFKGFHVHEMKYRWNPILLLIWYKFSLYRLAETRPTVKNATKPGPLTPLLTKCSKYFGHTVPNECCAAAPCSIESTWIFQFSSQHRLSHTQKPSNKVA